MVPVTPLCPNPYSPVSTTFKVVAMWVGQVYSAGVGVFRDKSLWLTTELKVWPVLREH